MLLVVECLAIGATSESKVSRAHPVASCLPKVCIDHLGQPLDQLAGGRISRLAIGTRY